MSATAYRWIVSGACLAFALSCAETAVDESQTAEPKASHNAPIESTRVLVTQQAVGDGLHALLNPPIVRERRRMTVEQLDTALRDVTGGIGWDDGADSVLDDLALTLGQPDFLDVTNEDLNVSPIFSKFLADGARDVCLELMEEDPKRTAEERTFFMKADVTDTALSNPTDVKANFERLILRFHGQRVATDSDEMAQWMTAFEKVGEAYGEDNQGAWQAMCVGLVTHPRFYTY
jgi:hypothetical protein